MYKLQLLWQSANNNFFPFQHKTQDHHTGHITAYSNEAGSHLITITFLLLNCYICVWNSHTSALRGICSENHRSDLKGLLNRYGEVLHLL